MLIRIVSSTDGGLDHTEFEIDGKMFGGDVQAVTFSHDCTKPYEPGKSNINIRMVYGDGKIWDSASGDPLPPIDDPDRDFDKVSDMYKKYYESRGGEGNA